MRKRAVAEIEPNHALVCEGRSKAWRAQMLGDRHETVALHPACRGCGANMGCMKCSGLLQELICTSCWDWAHEKGFIEHGRLLKTPDERADAIKFLRTSTSGLRLVKA